MNLNRHRFHKFRHMIGPIEHAVQANIALVIAQAMIIRLSLELQEAERGEPDVLVLLGFLAACAITVAIAVVLYRVIRTLPLRSARITSALVSIVVQATAFQVLFDIVS